MGLRVAIDGLDGLRSIPLGDSHTVESFENVRLLGYSVLIGESQLLDET